MKKVIIPCDNDVVDVEHTDEGKYYASIFSSGFSPQVVSFLTREEYESGQFYFLCCDSVTKGNSGSARFDTAKAAIEAMVETTHAEVFEFDDKKEMFDWIASKLVKGKERTRK